MAILTTTTALLFICFACVVVYRFFHEVLSDGVSVRYRLLVRLEDGLIISMCLLVFIWVTLSAVVSP